MKQLILLSGAGILLFGQNILAQEIKKSNDSYFKQCSDFSISKPLRELAELYPATESDENVKKEATDAIRNRNRVIYANQNPAHVQDPVVQRTDGYRTMAGPIVNFTAQPGDASPADPTGAAGPNHYVQAVNDQYRAYDKTGNPAMASLNLKSLWPGSVNEGDPIVLYDKFADRWFIQQFQQSGNKILLAISTTPDPTGTYYQYTFVPDASQFPDYPKFSIWPDGYYQTSNYGTQKIAIYERAKMLVGDKTAGMIVSTVTSSSSAPMPKSGFFSPLTLDADGQLPPNGTPNYLMFYLDDNQQSGVTDAIAMYKITTDWVNKKATVAFDQKLATQAFNSYFTGGSMKDISQPGSSTKLDALDGFFAYRAPYRVWTGYNSIVVCNVVNTGNAIGGIRWYELRQDNTTKAWSIYQQGTYAPADGVCRWVPSIAMDDNGSIGLAYNVVNSSNVYPGIRYTGRKANDPLGQMTFAEQTAIAGTSSLNINRWGDYSQTSLDPDGVTFWHTSEYCSSGQKTRIFSFKISGPNGVEDIQNQSEYNVFQSDNILHVMAGKLPSDERMNVDLFDVNGKQIIGKTVSSTANAFTVTMDITNLAKGVYLVRIGNSRFQHVVKVAVN